MVRKRQNPITFDVLDGQRAILTLDSPQKLPWRLLVITVLKSHWIIDQSLCTRRH